MLAAQIIAAYIKDDLAFFMNDIPSLYLVVLWQSFS